MIWSPAPLRLPTRGEWSGDCFLCVCVCVWVDAWFTNSLRFWLAYQPIKSVGTSWGYPILNERKLHLCSTTPGGIRCGLRCQTHSCIGRWVRFEERERVRKSMRPSWSVVSVLQIVASNYRLHFDSYSIRRRQSVSLPTWPALTQHLPRYLLHPTYPFRTLFVIATGCHKSEGYL